MCRINQGFLDELVYRGSYLGSRSSHKSRVSSPLSSDSTPFEVIVYFSVFKSFISEIILRIMFPQFVLAFLEYLHVLKTQFSQKLSSHYFVVGIASLSLYFI